jgi:hypothetical protein
LPYDSTLAISAAVFSSALKRSGPDGGADIGFHNEFGLDLRKNRRRLIVISFNPSPALAQMLTDPEHGLPHGRSKIEQRSAQVAGALWRSSSTALMIPW